MYTSKMNVVSSFSSSLYNHATVSMRCSVFIVNEIIVTIVFRESLGMNWLTFYLSYSEDICDE